MPGLGDSEYLELVGVVLVEEGDGHAHNAVVVAGNFFVSAHFDGIIVVVPVVSRLSSQVVADSVRLVSLFRKNLEWLWTMKA